MYCVRLKRKDFRKEKMKYVLINSSNHSLLVNVERLCFIQYDKENERLELRYQGGNVKLDPLPPEHFKDFDLNSYFWGAHHILQPQVILPRFF